MGSRLLLVGATGFAGRHFASAAAKRHEVIGTARADGVADLRCELTDPGSVGRAVEAADPDLVVNLAGSASVSASFREPAQAFDVNVVGVVNLLDAVARLAPSAHVTCVSSGEAYGRVSPAELPAGEEQQLRPVSPYGASKAAMELVCGHYARTHGLRIAIARAFNHVGPGQSQAFATSSFARQIAEAERRGESEAVLRTGDLSPQRDFSAVRDVAAAYDEIATRRLTGVYNVCSGRAIAVGELLEMLAEASHLPVRSETDSDLLRPSEASVLYGSAARLEQATGWRARLPLEETMADLLAWWRERVGG